MIAACYAAVARPASSRLYNVAGTSRIVFVSSEAALQGAAGAATSKTWVEKAADERKGADEIRHSTEELDRETKTIAERATRFDEAEVFLEIAIVLCSVALLTASRGFWLISFAGAAAAVVLAALGALSR